MPKKSCLWAHYVLNFNWLVNGAWMLFAPGHWFATLPGTADTGPFNVHLVRDFGTAFFLMGAFALVLLVRNKFSFTFHLWITAFFSLHGAIHFWELIAGHRSWEHAVRDIPLVFVPIAFLILLALPFAWEKSD